MIDIQQKYQNNTEDKIYIPNVINLNELKEYLKNY